MRELALTEEMTSTAEQFAEQLEQTQGISGQWGGHGWRRVFLACAEACDALRQEVINEAGRRNVSIELPSVPPGFGQGALNYAGHAGNAEGVGMWCSLIDEMARLLDDLYFACIVKLGVKLPNRQTFAETWRASKEAARVQRGIAALARGLMDLHGAITPWPAPPVGEVPPRRTRVEPELRSENP